jgi:hypothetical protein
MLLDGLQVRYQSLPVFLHKKGLTGLYEFSHKDLFTGRTITYRQVEYHPLRRLRIWTYDPPPPQHTHTQMGATF